MKFIEADHLVVKTTLPPGDESKLQPIVTALKLYDRTPGVIQIFGRDGDVLFTKGQTADLESYLRRDLGGVVESVTFLGPDYAVVKTSLVPTDQSNLRRLMAALELYEGAPSVVEVRGRDGDILPSTE